MVNKLIVHSLIKYHEKYLVIKRVATSMVEVMFIRFIGIFLVVVLIVRSCRKLLLSESVLKK